MQAIEFLNEQGSGKKYILIFPDLKAELAQGYVRDIFFQLAGFSVIALNVIKLRADNLDPKIYQGRVEHLRVRLKKEAGAGI